MTLLNRSVLIITHDYPPIRTAGTERVLRFAQYLPEFGYQPLILTTDRYGSLVDDEIGRVFRAGDMIHNFFGFLRKSKEFKVPPEQQVMIPTIANNSILGRLRDRVMVPDTKIGWALPALHLGKQLLQQFQPACIFSSSPPETVHVIAHRLSAGSGLPWVADLRDGWLFEPPNPSLRSSWARHGLEAQLERQMVHNSSWVVTATAPIAVDLATRYPSAASKISTITNGYEESEFDGLRRQRQPDGHFLLTYTGSLSSSRGGTSAVPLFEGLALYRHAHPATPLRLRIVGNIRPSEKEQASRFKVEDIVEFLPPVSRREAHQHQLDADALLLITAPGHRSVATLKLFEYIRAGRPILALAQGNVAADIVTQDDLGIIAPPDDPVAIAKGIERLLVRCSNSDRWSGFATAQPRYHRRQLTQALAQLFDRVLAS
jgi:glycosyltransferase involved in cell wall biosynthesis